MANASYQISNLLEKMTSTDKDYRFMATNDLMVELQKDSVKLDDDSEKKISKMLLRLLEDKNGEVQNLAVKCLGPLVNKAKEYQVETIVDKLCENMFSEREQLRDISSIGLKTVISELPPTSSSLAASICKRITGRLSKAIAMEEEVSVQLEALDIMGDLLSRFGGLLVTYHGPIQEALLPQLSSPRLAVRKRSILAIGHLVMSCNRNLYVELIDFLLGELSQNASISTTRTYIQCIGTISRQSGHRFGEHLERVMPFIVKYAEIDDDDELREYCLQAMESFVRRCPKEISSHVNTIIKICLKYICYDPNYNYEDDDESENNMELGEEEDGDSEEEYSDDDDMSWKVRRSSAKCLEAIISTRHELLSIYYRDVSPKLIDRFKEREENVKSDIFHAYIALLKQTRTTVGVNLGADAMESTESPVFLLQNQVPQLVKGIHRQMREKSIKTRQGCFALLTELVNVLHCALTDHIDVIIPGIQFSLGEKNTSSNMKIDTLAFLNCLLSTHPPVVFHPHTKILVPLVIAAVGDPFYKITSEALLVTQQLVHVIRPLDMPCVFDFTPYTLDIYQCTLIRLRAADIDQEVKERAISCMGQIISNLGDHLQNELSVCLPIFLDRLRNEITRLTTVKALTKIARSPLKIDFKPILMDAVPILASFLRKNQRSLKLSTLLLLDVLVQNYSNVLTPELFNKVMVELPPLLNESDLHVAQLTLSLLTSLAHMQKGALEKVNESVLPEIQNLVQSPLLQGAALQSMLDFFKALKEANLPWLKYHDLLNMITAPVNSPQGPAIIHKQAFHSMAKCVAALTTSHKEEAIDVVEGLLANIQKPSSDAIHLFSLLATGEIGRHIDLSCIPNLKEVFLGSFSAHSEEVKSAASYALGSVSVGNLPQFLPFVLKEIQAQPKRQYLLLHSLKEIISSQSSSPVGIMALQPFVAEIWTQLFNHCECSEEGTRNVVAECLGKLTLIDPSSLLGKLKENLKSESPLMRTTVVTAIKFTITDQPQPIDPLLKKYIGNFLSTLEDSDLNVRRVALVAFNSAAHNKPSLIRDLLESILPQLYNETKVRKMLIREVEMGPFKHTVDDGLDIRKAAFECMYTLLDSCLDRLDVFEFLNHVESGLKDHYDIKMLTYLMLVRLASLCPSGVLQKLDCLIEPLRATVTTKVKANSVKQEFEKQDELKRSALRAVAALLSIPDSDKHPGLQEFINQIKANPELELLYESIQKDTSNSLNDNLMMDLS